MSEPGASPLARDRPESPFARILAGFVQVHPGVLCAAFVDAEGECIDYASRIEPYDAQLIGAQLSALSAELATRLAALRSGPLVLWVLEAARREFVVRRVTDEHLVAIALAPHGLSARLLRATTALAEALRREGGLSVPGWDPGGEAFEVQIRPSPGWGYAPCALQIGGAESRALEVLGRWTERGSISAEDVVCFRVRAADDELTLAHDPSLDRWYRR